MSDKPIGPYPFRPATFHDWDPGTADVAERIQALVRDRWPDLRIEHVGSSAVPGMPGKNVVDLAALVDPVDVPRLRDVLLDLGFQTQTGRDPHPATRPLLLGSIDHEGLTYRIHFHVMPHDDSIFGGEFERHIAFREALRSDEGLRKEYAARKRAIVEESPGPIDGVFYSYQKTEWIAGALERLGLARGPILPPSTIGILGGGQLGRMLGLAARVLGYRLIVLDPDPDCPAAAVADDVIVAGYDDIEGAQRLAERSAVVTYELEHVSVAVVRALEERIWVRPGVYPLRVTQDRLAEREFLDEVGAVAAPWHRVADETELDEAADDLGFPLRLKASIGGYDGRSQVRIGDPSEVAGALDRLGRPGREPALLERELAFEAELSVVVARDVRGRSVTYPVARNVHDDGILVESVVPASIAPDVADRARRLGLRLAERLGLEGTLTAELFLMPDGELVVNELAPRVHNSGHWTIEGAATSQFEQHVRAICGLPLGSVEQHAAAAMVNLLGTGMDRPARVAGLADALASPLSHVHLYDKRRVFERRKMGHVTALGDSTEEALVRARQAASLITWAEGGSDGD